MITYFKASLFYACLLTIGTLWSAGNVSAAAPFHKSVCTTCPSCNACCELTVEEGEVDRHCWEIETKEICIPRVVFPWQKDCHHPGINNGAKIKTVRVLKKRDYTCPECTYTWTPVERACHPAPCQDMNCHPGPAGIDMGLSTEVIQPAQPPVIRAAPVIVAPLPPAQP